MPFAALPEARRSRRYPVLIPVASTLPSPTPQSPLGYRLTRAEPNTADSNSATTFYFQLPSRAPEDYLLVELLAEALEQPFYSSLRTKQQLGYIVFSGLKSREGILNLVFTVQSSLLTGAELTGRIETFLADEALPTMRSISKEDFKTFQEGLIVRKSEPDQRLTGQAGRFWNEISMVPPSSTSPPQFTRAAREIEFLQKVSKEQFVDFSQRFLSREGTARRLVVSEVTSAQHDAAGSAAKGKQKKGKKSSDTKDGKDQTSSYIEIEDELTFRLGLPQL